MNGDVHTFGNEEIASDASVSKPEEHSILPIETGNHSDMKQSASLPEDELVNDRPSPFPLKERRRSKSETRINPDNIEDQRVSLSPDDPIIQAVQREISEAFDVSDVELNMMAEDLLTDLAHIEVDGGHGQRLPSSASVYSPTKWQETYKNLPDDYTVTDV